MGRMMTEIEDVVKLYLTPPQLELFQTSETLMQAKSRALLCRSYL